MKKIIYSLLFLAVFFGASALEPDKNYGILQGKKALFVKDAEPQSGRKAVMWTDTEVPAQRWVLDRHDDDTYTFRNCYTDYYLGVNSTNAGATADQRVFSRYLTRWYLEASGDGWLLVPFRNTELCLAAASDEEDAALILVNKATADPALSVFTINADDTEIPMAYGTDVRDAVMDGFLRQYYHDAATGHVLGGGGWWGDAEMFETILDAFATTGDLKYKEIFNELYVNFLQRNGTDWSNNEFNDDITWMVLACVRAYQYFGVEDYLTKAIDNYTRMYNRAHQRFGTLIWKQSQENKLATNSCINCPATVAACYLGRLTGDKSWFTKAISIYAGQRKLLYNPGNGEVADSRAWKADGSMESDYNHWVSTYNQGTMLGAAIALYDHTKDPMYLQDAHKIYERSRNGLTNSNKIISVCQTINGDLCGFKGILMRYVRDYAEMNHLEEPLEWMEKNAWHAYQNRNSNGVIWSAWLTKTNENLRRMEGDSEKNITNDAFGSSTAVSVAFNAHVNRQFSKSAIDGLEAKYFDGIQFTQLDDELADGDTPNTTPTPHSNGYICFRNVNFGNQGLNKAVARVKATAGRSYIKIYADSIADETLLGRSSGFLTRQWQDADIEMSEALTGIHDVYVLLSGAGVQFHNIHFIADGAGVQSTVADGRCSMHIIGRNLVIDSAGESTLEVYNAAGVLELSRRIGKGTSTVALQPGVHICRLSLVTDMPTFKAIIK